MALSYPRKYYSVAYADLGTIPQAEGNIIATYDADGLYYDVGNPAGSGQNVVRRKANGIEFVDALSGSDPTKTYAREEPNTIFVLQNPDDIVDESGNSVKSFSGYIWNIDDEEFNEVFNNLRDFHVKTEVNTSTEAYIVASTSSSDGVETLIKNPNIYITSTGKLNADLDGNAATATRANSAAISDTATSATNDVNSQPITGYIHGITSDYSNQPLGSTLTITKGDGTSVSVYTQDTTYSVYSSSTSGLVPGYSTTVQSDNTDLVLSGSGWIDLSRLSIPAAESATKDGSGNTITETYVAGASYSAANQELTLTYGDGTSSSPISIPNTAYPAFTTDTDGIVNGPTSSDTFKFLRGDNTWQSITVTDYTGATASTSGVHGLVPAASAGEQDSYLKGDATWGGLATSDTSGLVPGPSSSTDDGKFLMYDASANSGNGGLVWTASSSAGNTAGATEDGTNKLFIIGAQAQQTSPQTYSNAKVFIDADKLYSNNTEVVNLSDNQPLTNKTYNGYTLGNASEGTIGTSLNSTTGTQDTFSGTGSTTSFTLTNTPVSIDSVTVGGSEVTNYTLQNTNQIVFTSAPASGTNNIVVIYEVTNPNYGAGRLPTTSAVTSYVSNQISRLNLGNKSDVSVIYDIYDSSHSYSSGDFCMYEDVDGYKLYKCTDATTGDFDPSAWTATTVIDVILSYHP